MAQLLRYRLEGEDVERQADDLGIGSHRKAEDLAALARAVGGPERGRPYRRGGANEATGCNSGCPPLHKEAGKAVGLEARPPSASTRPGPNREVLYDVTRVVGQVAHYRLRSFPPFPLLPLSRYRESI
jgi:hypothetical protein